MNGILVHISYRRLHFDSIPSFRLNLFVFLLSEYTNLISHREMYRKYIIARCCQAYSQSKSKQFNKILNHFTNDLYKIHCTIQIFIRFLDIDSFYYQQSNQQSSEREVNRNLGIYCN